METVGNYVLLWTIYLLASAVFFVVFWRITRFKRRIWLSYILRAVMLALALTPAYANQAGEVMAPALIVALLDAITIGGSAAVRAFVPLFLALIMAVVLASAWYLVGRTFQSKKHKNQRVA